MTAPILFPRTGYAGFEEMYESERSFVYGIVFLRVRDKAIAENLAQDTFMKALRRIDTYIPQEHKSINGSFKNWIGTIAKNTAINYLRRGKLEQTHQNNSNNINGDYNFSNPEELTMEKEELEGVLQSINGLPNRGVRETSRLWFLKDRSYQEISDQLKIPKGTVMSRLHRGKKQLKRNYQP